MIKLSERLKACTELVRRGKPLADIGTDHGYAVVYLVENKIVPRAVASDVNEGPLASCSALVKEHGLENKIKCVLSDGLKNIEENEAEDILIAGMGGELISDILENCPYVSKKHLILNPMTHPEILRKWLFENGFCINEDIVVRDGRHSYSILDAYYTGKKKAYTATDLFLGNIKDFSDKDYFLHLLNYLTNKEKGGADYAEVISAIKENIK